MNDKPQAEFKPGEWVQFRPESLDEREQQPTMSGRAAAVKSVEWNERDERYWYKLEGYGEEKFVEDALESPKRSKDNRKVGINPKADNAKAGK